MKGTAAEKRPFFLLHVVKKRKTCIKRAGNPGKVPKRKKLKSVPRKYLTIDRSSDIISNCAGMFREFCHAIQEDFP